jgi:hypothetical protein
MGTVWVHFTSSNIYVEYTEALRITRQILPPHMIQTTLATEDSNLVNG